MTILFHSLTIPGAVLNRFGNAMQGGRFLESSERDVIRREAEDAGWTLQPSLNTDEGMIYTPPV